MKKTTLILGLALLSSGLSFGQTAAERAQIIKNYDQENLEELRQDLIAQENSRLTNAIAVAKANDWPITKVLENGQKAHLYDVGEKGPIYRSTNNRIAGLMQGADHLWNGGSLGINIEGQNMEAGIWDGGKVLDTHESLTGRITAGQFLSGSDDHGTHVGGTMIADGTNANAKGMAPQASLVSYDFQNDTPEIVAEASQGMLISNHSYGLIIGNVSQSDLGKYTITATQWDNITYNAPYYLPVIAAGNDRNNGVNTSDNGYDILTGNSVAKNPLLVGASIGNPNYSGPASVPMSNFSSWGPTDDGRVKPDITTKGVGMYSTDNSSNSSYVFRQGTSMSTPAVSGGLILLQQYYNSLNSQYMLACTAKGLVLHTVKEAGVADGPDYQFGWGLLDTEAAATAIQEDGNTAYIKEEVLLQGTTITQSFAANTASKVIVSISWYDPAVAPNNGPEDDATPSLRNDLDIIVTDDNGTTFYPWKLNPQNFNNVATRNSSNDVDNFEKIEIDNPAGNYTVTVSHKGTLQGGNEDFALIITGGDQGTFSTTSPDELNTFSIYPNPATDHFTVAFNNQLSGDKIDVVLYDVLGQEVMSKSYDNNGIFEQRISTSSLDSGIYLVRVGNGVTASTRKLVVR
ncbi:MAG: S8 family serine peptidase [Nonlabens sp.]|uniref:S8 family serine peptidase n=1 Tax=Nonlabens sp. TaxID=1888209 RepID=UPI003EF8E92F